MINNIIFSIMSKPCPQKYAKITTSTITNATLLYNEFVKTAL